MSEKKPVLFDGVELKLGMIVFSTCSGWQIHTSEETHEIVLHNGIYCLRTKTDRPDSQGPPLTNFASCWLAARERKLAEELVFRGRQKIAEGCQDLLFANEIFKKFNLDSSEYFSLKPIDPYDYLKTLHYGFHIPVKTP